MRLKPFHHIEANRILTVIAWLFVAAWVATPQLCLAQGTTEPTISIEDVLTAIAARESAAHTIEAHAVVTMPELQQRFIEVDWGYDGSREYIKGEIGSFGAMSPDQYGYDDAHIAFNGDKLFLFFDSWDSGRLSGRITSMEPRQFRFFNLNALRGYELSNNRTSLSETLANAQTLELLEDETSGLIAIRAIGVDLDLEGEAETAYDGIVWLDPQRGFSPVKIETYLGLEGARFQALLRRVDNIQLSQINGVWVPVSGDSQTYSYSFIPKPGFDDNDIHQADSLEALLEVASISNEPNQELQHLDIALDSISINQPIADEKFEVVFPEGTIIFDEFLGIGYTAGVDAKYSSLSHEEVDRILEDRRGASPPRAVTNIDDATEAGTYRPGQISQANHAPPKDMFYWVLLSLAAVSASVLILVLIHRIRKTSTD